MPPYGGGMEVGMKILSKIITGVVIAAAIAAIGIGSYMSTRIKYNDEGCLGNTAGNLMNKGLFAEHNGKIYFSNPYDGDQLYSMNSDCTDIKKLSDDSVSYINVTDNYIFYVRNNFDPDNAGMIFRGQLYGIIRSKLNGKNGKALTIDVVPSMVLIGNRVYYGSYDNGRIQTMYTSIDKKETSTIKNTQIPLYSIAGSKVYYSGTDGDHDIHSLDLSSGLSETLLEGNTYLASMDDDILYYLDMSNNYALTAYDTLTDVTKVLYDGKCINYNIYDDVIFFQTEDGNNALHRMKLDGSGDTIIAAGNCDSISCTSQYTFFTFYGQNILYRVPTHDGTDVEVFTYVPER